MSRNALQKLSESKAYYLFQYKGYYEGVCNSKIIPIAFKKDRINDKQLAEMSYREISFMEYLSKKRPFIGK